MPRGPRRSNRVLEKQNAELQDARERELAELRTTLTTHTQTIQALNRENAQLQEQHQHEDNETPPLDEKSPDDVEITHTPMTQVTQLLQTQTEILQQLTSPQHPTDNQILQKQTEILEQLTSPQQIYEHVNEAMMESDANVRLLSNAVRPRKKSKEESEKKEHDSEMSEMRKQKLFVSVCSLIICGLIILATKTVYRNKINHENIGGRIVLGEGCFNSDGTLKEKHDLYFTNINVLAKISDLKSTRARPEGIQNAKRYMIQSCKAGNNKRKPIYVDSKTKKISDGNSSFKVAQENGWEYIPVIYVSACDKKSLNIIAEGKINQASRYKRYVDRLMQSLMVTPLTTKESIIIPPLKTKESLIRKIEPECFADSTGKILHITTWDILRYTILLDRKDFSNRVDELIKIIEDGKGGYYGKWTKSWIDNTFCAPNTYMGLNVNFQDVNSEFQWEIQFHTPITYKHKQRTHLAYESYRIATNPDKKACIENALINGNNRMVYLLPQYLGRFCKTIPQQKIDDNRRKCVKYTQQSPINTIVSSSNR